jgi:hypothetical protein
MTALTSTTSRPPSTRLDPRLVQHICDLYVTAGLSTRRIATDLVVPRRTVSAALHMRAVGVPARGAGRARPERFPLDPSLRQLLVELYVRQRLSRRQVAHCLGVPEGRVRIWLGRLDVTMRTRGKGRREDRRRVPRASLVALYVNAELPADQVAARLGATRGRVLASAHEQGVPVRPGGASCNERAVVLLAALYDDEQLTGVLQRHGVPLVRHSGSVIDRFPTPAAFPPGLAKDLYLGCGLSTVQIELVTGQPAATVRRRLIGAGVALRRAGGLAPFTRRARLAAGGGALP